MLLIYLNIREEFGNVAFIYVSDDMSWGTSRFKNQKNLYHFGAAQNMNEEARSGIADPDAAAYDLALMVNCNHTIISRGTFSMWMALLSGGEYYTEYGAIIPSHLNVEREDKQ